MDEKITQKVFGWGRNERLKKSIESASTHNEAKTIFVSSWVYDSAPFKFSLFCNIGVVRSTQAWKKVWECDLE